MVIFGRNAVREAVRANSGIEEIFIQNDIRGGESQELVDMIKDSGIKYSFLPKFVIDKKVTRDDRHQGFVAKMASYNYVEVEDIVRHANDLGEQLFVVLLDGVEDPQNFGNIIRTCECANVHGIIIPKHNACDVTPTVVKVSAGAVNHMMIAKVPSLVQTIESLKKQGVWVYSAELGGESIYKTNLKGDLALVVGSEGKGTRRLVKERCDGVFSLPQLGKVNSLNVSNALAISVYEALRQRMN